MNVTPDSFSDGGRHGAPQAAIDAGMRLWEDGADVIDVGGESTRPGAAPVSADEESARVLPVIEGLLARNPGGVLSIDTSKAAVARAALSAGVRVVNDVTAMSDPDMPAACAAAGCRVVLMHMRGSPRTMQGDTRYEDVLSEVTAHLDLRARAAIDAGVDPRRVLLDPGVGFGKDLAGNLALIAGIPRLRALGYPVLLGASRKSFLGALTGVVDAARRDPASIGVAVAAAGRGVDALRVHDVAGTRQALLTWRAVEEFGA